MADEEEDVCVVCMEPLSTDHVHTMDECGHRVHSTCIIGWLQRGHLNCPTCRGNLEQAEQGIPSMTLHDRAKHIRRTLGRRTNIPADLKRLLTRLRQAEASESDHRKQFREFQMTHKDVLKQFRKLRAKRWTHARAARRCERLLGLYQGPGIPLPALSVSVIRY